MKRNAEDASQTKGGGANRVTGASSAGAKTRRGRGQKKSVKVGGETVGKSELGAHKGEKVALLLEITEKRPNVGVRPVGREGVIFPKDLIMRKRINGGVLA